MSSDDDDPAHAQGLIPPHLLPFIFNSDTSPPVLRAQVIRYYEYRRLLRQRLNGGTISEAEPVNPAPPYDATRPPSYVSQLPSESEPESSTIAERPPSYHSEHAAPCDPPPTPRGKAQMEPGTTLQAMLPRPSSVLPLSGPAT
jgi:hypothetical protein